VLCILSCVVLTPTPRQCGTEGVWTVKSLSGFVAPPSGGQVSSDAAPWSPDAPCLLEFNLSVGHRLNVTLLDFASRPGDVTSHVVSHAETAKSSSLSDRRRVSLKLINITSLLRHSYRRTEIHAGRVDATDKQTDRQTEGRQTVTLRFPLDVVGVITRDRKDYQFWAKPAES